MFLIPNACIQYQGWNSNMAFLTNLLVIFSKALKIKSFKKGDSQDINSTVQVFLITEISLILFSRTRKSLTFYQGLPCIRQREAWVARIISIWNIKKAKSLYINWKKKKSNVHPWLLQFHATSCQQGWLTSLLALHTFKDRWLRTHSTNKLYSLLIQWKHLLSVTLACDP